MGTWRSTAACHPDLIAADLLELVAAAGVTAAALVMVPAKCGETNPAMRDGDYLKRWDYGYST